ncbi:MAG: GntR family transcriptional regulator [Ilumatobacteraceae bacterium]
MSEQAYQHIRRMIVRLELAPGAVVREDVLQRRLGIGRTPIREALQRLARDQFVTVVARRGMFVSSIDVAELSMLYETRAILEPYAARLACARGEPEHWDAMAACLDRAGGQQVSAAELIDIDRECHEIVWAAAGNRFLTSTLDMLYAQSDRLWHMYLADVADMAHAVGEHRPILDALVDGDGDRAAELIEGHVRAFDRQIRDAVTRRLGPPLAGTSVG